MSYFFLFLPFCDTLIEHLVVGSGDCDFDLHSLFDQDIYLYSQIKMFFVVQ